MNILHTLSRGLLVLAPALMAFPAVAARLEIQAGRSYMDRHAANVVFAESVFGAYRLGGSPVSWSPDLSVGWIDGRDLAVYQHARYGTAAPVWLVAAGIRLMQAVASGTGGFSSAFSQRCTAVAHRR